MAHARMVRCQMLPHKINEAETVYRNSVLPAAQQQNGFIGAFLLKNEQTGKGVSITLWQTIADMEAAEKNGYYQEQINKFAAFFTALPETERYEVVSEQNS